MFSVIFDKSVGPSRTYSFNLIKLRGYRKGLREREKKRDKEKESESKEEAYNPQPWIEQLAVPIITIRRNGSTALDRAACSPHYYNTEKRIHSPG